MLKTKATRCCQQLLVVLCFCGTADAQTYDATRYASGRIEDGTRLDVPAFSNTTVAIGTVSITVRVSADMDGAYQGVDLVFNGGTTFSGHSNLLAGKPLSCTAVYSKSVTATAAQWNSQRDASGNVTLGVFGGVGSIALCQHSLCINDPMNYVCAGSGGPVLQEFVSISVSYPEASDPCSSCPAGKRCCPGESTCRSCCSDSECPDNGQFCDGDEYCSASTGCRSSGDPCSPLVCDESSDACLCAIDTDCDDEIPCTTDACLSGFCNYHPNDASCDNSVFCDGVEFCDPSTGCGSPGDPCLGNEYCNEVTDNCDECLEDWHCDDDAWCNGAETCVSTVCQPGPDNLCTEGQACFPGLDECRIPCVIADDCDNGDPCTDGSCSVDGYCEYASAPNGTPCSTGLWCSDGNDKCNCGICVGTGNRCTVDPYLFCNERAQSCEHKADYQDDPCKGETLRTVCSGICKTTGEDGGPVDNVLRGWGWGCPRSYTFVDVPYVNSPVLLRTKAYQDLVGVSRNYSVHLTGVGMLLCDLYFDSAGVCEAGPWVDRFFEIPAVTWNMAVANATSGIGNVEFELPQAGSSNCWLCNQSAGVFVEVTFLDAENDCNENGIADECDLMDWDVDGDVDLQDAAAFLGCFDDGSAPCSSVFDLALACGSVDLSDYAVLTTQLTGPPSGMVEMMGGGGESTALPTGEPSESPTDMTEPAASSKPEPWLVTAAPLTFEVRPIGGRDAVTALTADTTYEVYYEAGYREIQEYVVAVVGTSPEARLTTVEPAPDGEWADTGEFEWMDLSDDPDGPYSAIGYPEGELLLGLAHDRGKAGREGAIFHFTTGQAGELTINLKMWWMDEADRFAVTMEAELRFDIVPVRP